MESLLEGKGFLVRGMLWSGSCDPSWGLFKAVAHFNLELWSPVAPTEQKAASVLGGAGHKPVTPGPVASICRLF